MSTQSSGFNAKGALVITVGLLVLFAGAEVYGLTIGGDWSILMPTIAWQVLALVLIVSPMIYALVYASHHDDV